MKVRFVSVANEELDEAVRYYEHQLAGLGLRFFREVNAAIDRILFMPEAWTKIGERTRRCMIKGFPYAVLYVADPNEIVVTAIAHLHSDPVRYNNRII